MEQTPLVHSFALCSPPSVPLPQGELPFLGAGAQTEGLKETAMRRLRTTCSTLVLLALGCLPPAQAQEPEGCPGLIASGPSLLSQAALRQVLDRVVLELGW